MMPRNTAEPFVFAEVARVAAPGDNVAIALQTLPAGSRILIRQLVFEFAHSVLEGHRFAIHRIRKGDPLLSWGLPFGLAARDIEPGEYLCNEKILRSLGERSVQLTLPPAPNFVDHRLAFQLDEAGFKPAEQVTNSGPAPVFRGFRRDSQRGAGTRNFVVVLGTSSRSAGFVRSLANRFQNVRASFPNIDGVVAVAHTEGGSTSRPHNFDLTLRTLAGFVVNPNVGAVFCVDFGNEAITNEALARYLRDNRYPTEDLLHDFFSIGSSFESALDDAQKRIASWLPMVDRFSRESLPITHLKLGLQCGGSDAFSGISANPLVGILSRETVAFGGSANLAETDELIGAETYVLQKVRDLGTAQAFLKTIDRFQEWASWHGHSAEGNPSGGNMFRGLYNITIKSIGAARKKDPATRLDYVIDFGEPMERPGFYFMNSPGNDLESIAGQVASGCNMILFATGNGSITNFPFVPTLKYMTTTRRFELVRNEMDFNAGRYLDGEPLERLGEEAFAQLLEVASGAASAGERAGHSQVQLWREWRGGASGTEFEADKSAPGLETGDEAVPDVDLPLDLLAQSPKDRVALVLPTSLCSGQIASLIAAKLVTSSKSSFTRAVALPHTEGCGNSAGESERLFLRTMAGYLAHPLVRKAVLLEHGCEKTHNDAFRHILRDLSIDPARFGYASIQMDGGIERVVRKVLDEFSAVPPLEAGAPFSLAIMAQQPAPLGMQTIAAMVKALAGHPAAIVLTDSLHATGIPLPYGARFEHSGVFSMECPSDDVIEIITGLGATGAEVIVVFASDGPVAGNPLVPTLQVASKSTLPEQFREDVDLLYDEAESAGRIAERIFARIGEIRSGRVQPRNAALGNTAFQVTRGRTGISL